MYLLGLGAAPFLDPPEGFHAAVAESLRASGDWTTLRADGVHGCEHRVAGRKSIVNENGGAICGS